MNRSKKSVKTEVVPIRLLQNPFELRNPCSTALESSLIEFFMPLWELGTSLKIDWAASNRISGQVVIAADGSINASPQPDRQLTFPIIFSATEDDGLDRAVVKGTIKEPIFPTLGA